MKRNLLWCLGLSAIVLCSFAGRLRAQDEPASQPSTAPSTAPSSGPIEASEQQALKDAAGKTLTVHGKVSGTFKPSSGIVLVNFEGARRGFCLMIPKESLDAVNAGFDGDIGEALKGRSILVTGEIKLFRDRPEMEITKPGQITIEEKKD